MDKKIIAILRKKNLLNWPCPSYVLTRLQISKYNMYKILILLSYISFTKTLNEETQKNDLMRTFFEYLKHSFGPINVENLGMLAILLSKALLFTYIVYTFTDKAK